MILSLIGLPAAFCAGWAVEITWIGRRGTVAISSGKSFITCLISVIQRPNQGLLAPFCSQVQPLEAPTLCLGGIVDMYLTVA